MDSARFRFVNKTFPTGSDPQPKWQRTANQCQGSDENRSHAHHRVESTSVGAALACRVHLSLGQTCQVASGSAARDVPARDRLTLIKPPASRVVSDLETCGLPHRLPPVTQAMSDEDLRQNSTYPGCASVTQQKGAGCIRSGRSLTKCKWGLRRSSPALV